ncbi:MAG TPA: hypothetical protein VF796_10220, partial [Humisphaera sp.]
MLVVCAANTAWASPDRHPPARAVAATLPAPADPTLDALREIDAAPVPAAPPAVVGAGGAGDDGLSGRWALFAPTLIVAGAIGVAGAVLGTFVLLRREALVALAVPQVVAAGAAVGLRLGWPTFPPAMAAAAAGLGYLVLDRRRADGSASAASRMAVPALYVAGLCFSFLVIAGSGAHVAELQHLFTGVDVAVAPAQAAA